MTRRTIFLLLGPGLLGSLLFCAPALAQSCLEASATSAYDITASGFTVECRVLARSIPFNWDGERNPRVVHCIDPRTYKEGCGSTGTNSWEIAICYDNCGMMARVGFGMTSSGSCTSVDHPMRLGQWVHVAGTYDGSKMRLFLDGTAVESLAVANHVVTVAGGRLRVGDPYSGGPIPDIAAPFDGQVDEVRIWNLARTQPQIAGNQAVEVSPSETGLAAYWRLNGSGANQLPGDPLTSSGIVSFVPTSLGQGADITPDQPPAPPAPAGVSATQNVPGVTVTWLDGAGNPTYQVYRDGVLIGTTAAHVTSFCDPIGAGTHEYCVAAANTYGVSASSCATGTSTGCATPPGGVSASQDTLGVTATWVGTSCHSGYRIRRDGVLIASPPANTTSYYDPIAAGTYQYCVSAMSECGESSGSCASGTSTGIPPPPPPGGVWATQDAPGVTVTWADGPREDGYRVHRDGNLIASPVANATSWFDSIGAGQHEYCVRAYNQSGESSANCAIGISTGMPLPPPAPGGVTASQNTPGVTVRWGDVSGETGFRIRRDGVLIVSLGANSTSYFDPIGAGTYDYCVAAYNPFGESAGCATGISTGSQFLHPISYWPMEGDGRDSVGGNTLSADPRNVSYGPGHAGLAATFNGSGSTLWGRALPGYGITAQGFTLDCWVSVQPGFVGSGAIANAWNEVYGWWQLGAYSPDGISTTLWAPFGPQLSCTITDHDVWHHVAVRYDGLDLSLFLDGYPVGTFPEPSLAIAIDPGGFEIGSYFMGRVDEVRIWGAARSPLDIWADAGHAPGAPTLSTPANLAASDGATCGASVVTWDAVPSAGGYRIFRDRVFVTDVGAGTLSWTDGSCPPGPHAYAVKAFATSGPYTFYSAAAADSGFAPSPTPLVPALVDALSGPSDLRLTWRDVAGEDGYRIRRAGALLATLPANDTTFTDGSPIAGSTEYCIEPFNVCGSPAGRCITLTSPCSPASRTWVRALDGVVGGFNDVALLPDGSAIAAGSTGNPPSRDVLAARFDPVGNLVWSQNPATTGNDYANAVTVTPDGGALLAGVLNVSLAMRDEVYLVRLDGAGNVLWTRTYGGAYNDNAVAVRTLADGGFVVLGRQGITLGTGRAWLLRLDGNGDIVWTANPGVPPSSRMGLLPLADGGCLVGGGDAGNCTVVRLDSTRALVWEAPYLTASANIMAVPGGYAAIGDASGTPAIGLLDADGNWVNEGWFNVNGPVYDACATAAGEVVGVGCSSSPQCSANGGPLLAWGHVDAALAGDWERCVPDTLASMGNGIARANDGSYVMAGVQCTSSRLANPTHPLIARVDCSGVPVLSVPGEGRTPRTLAFSAPWPNPTRGALSLRLDLPRAERVELAVYDVAGRRLATAVNQSMPAGSHTLGLDLARQVPGMYFLRAQVGARRLTRSIIVLK